MNPFDPADDSNPTAVVLLEPICTAVLPGWGFHHGTLKQLNEMLDALPAGARAVCVNDLTSMRLSVIKTGAVNPSFAPTLLFCIKSNEDDSPDVRDGYTREALAGARALLYRLNLTENITVTGAAEGSTFLDLFDANLDGAEFAFRFDLVIDRFNYCAIPVVPTAPAPAQ